MALFGQLLGENMLTFHILSGVTTISMIILRYQILVSKQKNNCNVFFFC